MEDLKFASIETSYSKSKKEIASWDNQFENDPKYNSIKNYILEDKYTCLNDVIASNYENYQIGDDETKLIVTIKNNQDEIVAFVICQEYSLQDFNPELFIQYLVVKPTYQNQGLGTEILSRLPDEIEKITSYKPQQVYGYVNQTNNASKNLLKKLGFEFQKLNDPVYCRAIENFPAMEKI